MGVPLFICRRCGRAYPKQRYRCRRCGSPEFNVLEASHGKLVSFTEIHAVRVGFKRPLRLGVVELDNGGKVVGILDLADPKMGDRVVVTRNSNLNFIKPAD
ncbi:MAG: OB-fold domain-containing protein [Aigarchaeota archaeon]|nr:OB-fold domain-containing protein [Aigarchaeota archaeon]MDW8092790.1 OB-fold domain-containing protein [Nitrososphaerota archaeon]